MGLQGQERVPVPEVRRRLWVPVPVPALARTPACPPRSWIKNQGYPDDLFDGRPVIGIAQSHSDFNPCNGHFRELAEKVKIGVWEAGGFPLEFPTISLGESLMRPTAMLFRNLMAMDVEENIRAYPMDGVVLLAGCDKTTPGPVCAPACPRVRHRTVRPPRTHTHRSWALPAAVFRPSSCPVAPC